MFKDISDVYLDNHMKPVNTLVAKYRSRASPVALESL
jgi:hypothetical protein